MFIVLLVNVQVFKVLVGPPVRCTGDIGEGDNMIRRIAFAAFWMAICSLKDSYPFLGSVQFD